MSNFDKYLLKINQQFQTGLAREHSYRAPFQNYLDALLPDSLCGYGLRCGYECRYGFRCGCGCGGHRREAFRLYGARWLKDRVGRKLTFEEVLHYQKMVSALAGTIRVMEELDVIP